MGPVPNDIGSRIILSLSLSTVWTPSHNSVQAIFVGLGVGQCEYTIRSEIFTVVEFFLGWQRPGILMVWYFWFISGAAPT